MKSHLEIYKAPTLNSHISSSTVYSTSRIQPPSSVLDHSFRRTLHTTIVQSNLSKPIWRSFASLPLPLTYDWRIFQFLLSAAIVGTALASTPFDTTTVATFDVYNITECASTGLSPIAAAKYFITSTVCTNTPPNPDLALLPFLSYRPTVNVPPGETCYFDVYAGKDCTDNFIGFQSMASNNNACQEVTVGTTGNEATLGARSVKMLCRTWSTMSSGRSFISDAESATQVSGSR